MSIITGCGRVIGLGAAVLAVAWLWSGLAGSAYANQTNIQPRVNFLYGFLPACSRCHEVDPAAELVDSNASNADNPGSGALARSLALDLAFISTDNAIIDAKLRQYVDASHAPRFSASALTFSGYNKSSGSASINLFEGSPAFRLSPLPYVANLSLDDSRFKLTGTGGSRSLVPNSSLSNPFPLKNMFGTLPLVTVSSINSEGLFNSTALRNVSLTIILANELASLTTTDYAFARAGVARTAALAVSNPDGDTLEFELLTPSPGDGITLTPDTGILSVTAPTPMPSSYARELTIRIKEKFNPDKDTPGNFRDVAIRILSEPGTNIAPEATTADFLIDEGTSQGGTIATDLDGNTLTFKVGTATIPVDSVVDLPHGAITITRSNATTYTFTYVGKDNDPAADIFAFTVEDGIAAPDSGTLTFNKNSIDDAPVVNVKNRVGTPDNPNLPGDVNIEVRTDGTDLPVKATLIDFQSFITDKDTDKNEVNYRILKYVDVDETGTEIPPATYGTFSPFATGNILRGQLTYTNRINVALNFYIYFRVANKDTVPSGADCVVVATDCGRVRVVVRLNGFGRHTDDDRKALASQLGSTYFALPGSANTTPNFFKEQGDGACHNCHTPRRVTAAAPSCDGNEFFNELGRRLCRIDPFNSNFGSRIGRAIVGSGRSDSFEPTVTLSEFDLEVSDSTAVGTLIGQEMSFTTGKDLDGNPSRILKAYLEGEADTFFDIAITDDGAGDGIAKGRLRVKRNLALFTGTGAVAVVPLPVNAGGQRNAAGAIVANKEGFFPRITLDPVQHLTVTLTRELPKVADDAFRTNIAPQPITLDVTANDTDGGPVDRVILGRIGPTKGTVTIEGKDFVYVSDGVSTGTDTFTYIGRRDGAGDSLNEARVTIEIFDLGTPVAVDDRFFATVDGSETVLGVKDNDRIPPGLLPTIAIVQPPTKGTARLSPDREKIIYEATDLGTDTFTYELRTGANFTIATVTVSNGNVSGNLLANATLSKELKPVAQALGDTCQMLDRSAGIKTIDQEDLLAICNGLADDAQGGATLDQAMDQVRNEETLVAGDAAMQHDQAAAGNILGRLDAVRGGKGRGMNFSQFNLQVDDTVISGALVDATLAKTAKEDQFAKKVDLPWGVFVAGTMSVATQDNSEREAGFDMGGVMLTAGIDYALNDDVLLGLAISGGQSFSEMGGGSQLAMQSLQASLYGSFNIVDGLFIDGYGGVAANFFDMQRAISFASNGKLIDRTAAGVFEGESISAALRLKYQKEIGEALLSTYGTLSYVAVFTDAYVEKGAGGLGLSVGEQNFDALTATIGARLSGNIKLDGMVIKPYLGASYARLLDSDERSVFSHFKSGLPGSPGFLVTTESDGVNFGNVELGFAVDYLDQATVNVDLAGSFSDGDFESYSVRAGLTIPLGVPPPPEPAEVEKPVVRARKPSPYSGDVPPPPDDDTDNSSGDGGGGSSGGGGWN